MARQTLYFNPYLAGFLGQRFDKANLKIGGVALHILTTPRKVYDTTVTWGVVQVGKLGRLYAAIRDFADAHFRVALGKANEIHYSEAMPNR